MQQVITKNISITPSEVRRFYSQIPADTLPYYNSDVEVSQIVRKAKVSDAQKAEARQKLMELREQIFAKFFRAMRDRDHAKPSGSGMGLAIAKGIVEAHGGRIWVEDGADGRGAKFVVALPSQAEPRPLGRGIVR